MTFNFPRIVVQALVTAALFTAVSASAAPVTLAWAPNTEANLAGYLVSYGTAPGEYGTTIDVGTDATFHWDTPSGSAVYYFVVQAYDSEGQQSAYSAEVNTAAVAEALRVTALTANRVAPQAPGTAITLAAEVTGGTAPYTYKWWIISETAGWSVLQDWGPAPTLVWTPAVSSTYQIAVWARSAGNTANASEGATGMSTLLFPIAQPVAPLAVSAVTADRPSPQPAGTAWTFSAAATGGTGPYTYKWWMISDTTPWTAVQAWSSSPTFTFTPPVASHYEIAVWVRSAGNTVDASEGPTGMGTLAVQSVTAVQPLAVAPVTISRPSPQVAGTALTFSVAATGGTGPYTYKWWLISDTTPWTAVQAWSSSPTFTFTPPAASHYEIAVWVRSAGNTVDASEGAAGMKTMAFQITAPVTQLSVTLAANKAAPMAAGQSVTFTATPQGAAAGRYKFWVFNGSTWAVGREWAINPTFTWKPRTANPLYKIRVHAETAATPSVLAEAVLAFAVTK